MLNIMDKLCRHIVPSEFKYIFYILCKNYYICNNLYMCKDCNLKKSNSCCPQPPKCCPQPLCCNKNDCLKFVYEKKSKCCPPPPCCPPTCCNREHNYDNKHDHNNYQIYTAQVPVYDSRGVSGSFGGIGNSLTQSYGIIPGPVDKNVNNTLGN